MTKAWPKLLDRDSLDRSTTQSHAQCQLPNLPMNTDPVRLEPKHATQYRALMLDAYGKHPDAFTSSVSERSGLPISWWEDRLTGGVAPKEVVFGCFVDESLAGVVGLAFDGREKARHKATLFGMYVSPQYRSLGLASQLMRRALEFASSRPSLTMVQLTVTAGNGAAQRLYERHGFVQFGLEPYAVSVGEDFVSKSHMWRRLG